MLDTYFEAKIHKLVPLKYGQNFVYIPVDYDSELKDYIKAALAHKHTGIKSADYLLKRYIERYKVEPSKKTIMYLYSNLLDRVLETCCEQVNEIYSSFYAINYQEQTVSSLAVDSTLSRLINSYECVIFLIRNRFYFESSSIIRVIFEQLTYCTNVCDITNEEYLSLSNNKFKSIFNSTSINKIKNLFPEYQIGRLYAKLSELAHIDHNQVSNFLHYDEQDGRYVIVQKKISQSIDSALTLLQIIDLHSFIFEYTLRRHIPTKLKYIKKINSGYKINSSRKLNSLRKRFLKEFDALLEKEKTMVVDPKSTVTRNLNFLKNSNAL